MIKDKNIQFTYKGKDPELMLRHLDMIGVEYYVRESEYSLSILFGNKEYFYSFNSEISKGLYLIGMVKKDFISNAKKKSIEIFTDRYRSFFTNNKFDKSLKTIKYDINHAYWRIAYNDGIISKNTYEHGLKIKSKGNEYKKIYCLALSVQGNKKKFFKYHNGKKTKQFIEVENDYEYFKSLYDHIRNKTFSYMDELAYKLKDSFKEYNVDCIEFEDTEENKKIASDYLTSKNLTFKIITK